MAHGPSERSFLEEDIGGSKRRILRRDAGVWCQSSQGVVCEHGRGNGGLQGTCSGKRVAGKRLIRGAGRSGAENFENGFGFHAVV